MELAPGLIRVGNDKIAIHAILTPDVVTLIDAGLAGLYRPLLGELAKHGKSPEDIRGIVLTHGDSDHIGFAERLRTDYGLPVFVHSADAERAKGNESTKPEWGGMRVLSTLGFIAFAATRGGLRTRYLGEVVTMTDGDGLDLPGSPEIIGMPGHSPGSIAVHVPAVGAVFVGDALTTRHVLTGRTGPQPAPFTDDQAAASASLDRLVGTEAEWVIPGHGPAWHGSIPALIAAYRAAE
ncbi:MBL fold metallo-hydrolase [Luethyella okanaganae]|uniref:MBL fold metallo-hydrolase n=1 Tax=Luethyella okanaganae TaxID=69372 RepID=A0ABW1VDK9_9MICO